MADLTLQIWLDDVWTNAASVWVDDERLGVASPSRLEYDITFLDRFSSSWGRRDSVAVSCRYPLGYELFSEPTWPAVLLDLIPSGAARRFWEEELALPNAPSSDWAVLVAGGTNPVGNVRVEAAESPPPKSHPGFARSDILERREDFIEYARKSGASIAGSSGAGGDSPKLLLREDHRGRFHADGALADELTKACWLVKFPRTRDKIDRVILEAEAAYEKVAWRCGARTIYDLTRTNATWERDCLFVPRFDRQVRAGRGPVARLGVESLASLAGVAAFGARTPKETLATALATFATDPEKELREFVLRDVLDVALGNTDNHARNTAVLKDTTIELSPIFDFCPMILDPRGVARVCRWVDGADYPDWSRVAEFAGKLGVSKSRKWIRELSDTIGELPRVMTSCGVPKLVIDRCEERIARVGRDLAAVK